MIFEFLSTFSESLIYRSTKKCNLVTKKELSKILQNYMAKVLIFFFKVFLRQIYALGGQKIKKYLEKLVQFIIQIALYRNLGLNPGLNFLGLA